MKQTEIQIDTAAGGKECLDMVKKKVYDIIFIDHMMPEMNGVETLQAMKTLSGNLNKNTPTISLTANAMSGAREEYLAAGFQDYLTKPINCDRLEKMIVKFLSEEKVVCSVEIDPENRPVTEETSLPEELFKIEGLNIKSGVEHCGSEDAYLEVLSVFANSIADSSEEIENYFAGEDWKNYTTKVHALKSTSKVIGADGLSAMAKSLEDAGNEGRIDEIKQNHDALMTLYLSYAEKLKTFIDAGEDDSDKPLIDETELAEAFDAMRDIAKTFDYDSMNFVFQSLDAYRLPDKEKEIYAKIKNAADKLDWDTINDLLKN